MLEVGHVSKMKKRLVVSKDLLDAVEQIPAFILQPSLSTCFREGLTGEPRTEDVMFWDL